MNFLFSVEYSILEREFTLFLLSKTFISLGTKSSRRPSDQLINKQLFVSLVIKPVKNKVVLAILSPFQRSSKLIINSNSNFKSHNKVKSNLAKSHLEAAFGMDTMTYVSSRM